MLDGLFISLVGMGAVFASLTIIMFLMMGIERMFRSEGLDMEEEAAVSGVLTLKEPVKTGVEPESPAEVAAMAIALASFMKEHGRSMGKSMAIDGVNYQVEVEDTSGTVADIVINGESYRGSVGDHGLPLATQATFRIESKPGDNRRERVWRTSYPPSQGGYWTRRGWTGRHRGV